MIEKTDDEKICIQCMAAEVSGRVLETFTDLHPEVKMSYAQWQDLEGMIEHMITQALGGEERDKAGAADTPTMQ